MPRRRIRKLGQRESHENAAIVAIKTDGKRRILRHEPLIKLHQIVALERHDDRADKAAIAVRSCGQRVDDLRSIHAPALGHGDIKTRQGRAQRLKIRSVANRHIGRRKESARDKQMTVTVEDRQRLDLRMRRDQRLKRFVKRWLIARHLNFIGQADFIFDTRNQFAIDIEQIGELALGDPCKTIQRCRSFRHRPMVRVISVERPESERHHHRRRKRNQQSSSSRFEIKRRKRKTLGFLRTFRL